MCQLWSFQLGGIPVFYFVQMYGRIKIMGHIGLTKKLIRYSVIRNYSDGNICYLSGNYNKLFWKCVTLAFSVSFGNVGE